MAPAHRRTALAALGLLALLLAYEPALRAGFIWDDDVYVTDNANLVEPGGLRRIWLEPRTSPQYYPVVHTSFWIEQRLWGSAPFGYHLVNVLLHFAAALLVWRLLERLGVPGAALAAAVFALHPVHVESVAWVTERKNVLSGVLYLAAFLAYLRFDAGGPGRWRAYALASGLFLGALGSKTVTASLPAAVAVVLWWRDGRLEPRRLAPLLPLLALGAAAGLATAWLEAAHVGASGEEWSLSPVGRCLVAARALWFYLGKLEVQVERPLEALRALGEQDWVLETSIFGNLIHVVVDAAEEGERRIRELLESDDNAPVEVAEIVPSLEDVFIHQIERHGLREGRLS